MTNRRTLLQLLTLGATLAPVLKHTSRAAPQLPPNLSCSLRARGLRVEWRSAPLGIDTPRPRFSWLLTPVDKTARDLEQSACRVVIASSATAASAGHGELWDSGKHSSTTPAITPSHDLLLQGQSTYYWSVCVWDQHGRACDWSTPEPFTTGITTLTPWRAQWIAASADQPIPPGPPPAINNNPPVEPHPLPLFRRGFEVTKPVARAIVCVCGLGQYELRLNGTPVGTALLDPGWTDYAKTILYNTFDVTSLIQPGSNMLGLMLGNGMYNVEKYAGRYTKRVGTFGQPKLILQLRVVFTDGSDTLIVSDGSWRTRPGPIILSQTYGGEDYDARLDPVGWDRPDLTAANDARTASQHDNGWVPVIGVSGPGGQLKAQNVPPVVITNTLTTVSVTRPRPRVTVYDLGENFSGWPRIVVRGPAGSRVKLLPGELLDDTGLVSQRSANARPGNEVSFSYILGGTGDETWAPRFTYYGFRYVQVEGALPAESAAPGDTVLVSLSGEFLHADLPRVGRFECANPLLNRIHALIVQALLSNTMSVLTDCPQREKLGWLEQTYLNADTVFYNEDAVTLYEKMLGDMRDAQLSDGIVPEIAPEYVAFLEPDLAQFRNSPEWGAALVLSPWATYRYTGDARILENGYPSMVRYVSYLRTRLKDGLLEFGLGDWYDIGPQPPGVAQLTSLQLTGTAVYCEMLRALARIARILGREADAAGYEHQAASATHTFNSRLLDPTTSRYDRGSMTASAMPLAIGLVPEKHRQAVLANLVADIRAHDNHVTAGDVGFHYVVLALMENGRGDVLYDVLTRTDSPSYGYQLARGATALTEAWDANPNKSQNHFMLGHAETWLYGGLAGIRIDFDRPAASRIRIAPQVVAGVESARARYQSVWGEIVSGWQRRAGRIHLEVEIPAGARARIEFPRVLEVGSGRYTFEAPDLKP